MIVKLKTITRKVTHHIAAVNSEKKNTKHVAISTLKRQVGCFNHRVVTLVAILSGLHKVSFGI